MANLQSLHSTSLSDAIYFPSKLYRDRYCRRSSVIVCKNAKNEEAWKENKSGVVDYDSGEHSVSIEVSGFRKEDLQRRYRIRVRDDRFQKDWTISDVVRKVLELQKWDDIDGVLNHWIGRFSRKNFPVLIKELTQSGSIEHSNRVFTWMKLQKNYCARTEIYNMMIRLHSRHNRSDEARGLFFEMQEWRCKPDAETYNALIHAHGRAGQWRWAMNIMEDMLRAAIPPSRTTYNNLINACGSSGNWKEALKVSKKMTENGVGPDLVTHNIILSAYKTGAEYWKALSYFDLMKGTGIRPDTTTLNIVIHCLSKLGKYSEAVDIFNSMRNKRSEAPPDVVTFTSIIHLYSISGQLENCKAVFNTMVGEGMKPNTITYNSLIAAYASHGMSTEALSVFNEIKRNGFRPDIVSYTSLLNAYGRSKQPRKAREIFELIRKNNCKANVVTYNALIDAYASNDFLSEGVAVLKEMEQNDIQPNVVSFCTLLAACGRSRQKVKIDSILSAAESRGIRLNTVAYNSAIGSYMNVGEYEKAIDLYRLMKKKVKPDSVTFNTLISGCSKMSMHNEALEFFGEMEDLRIPLSKEVYSSVICSYSNQGKLTEAESVFAKMKTEGCSPDIVTYTTMIHAYGVSDSWEKASALCEEMEMNGIQLDSVACSALMRTYNKGCQHLKVIALANYMKNKEIPFCDAALFEMISACSILRDWKTALDLIKMIEPSLPNMSVGLLNHLLLFIGKSGKIETMMKMFYKVVARGGGAEINFSTYSVVLRNLLYTGHLRKCIEVLQWMENEGTQPSVGMYQSILSFAQKNNASDCVAMIQQKLESVNTKNQKQVPDTLHLDPMDMNMKSA